MSSPDTAPSAPLLPPALAALPAGPVIAFAPHADDETLGCGGALALHARRGDEVRVVVVSDGSGGDPNGFYAGRDYVALREAEAHRALRCLGVSQVEFLRHPDGGLAQAPHLEQLVSGLLERVRPAVVYGPSPWETHPDHWAVARALERALAAHGDIQWWAYEVWTPVRASHLIDIGPVWEQKRQAIGCYESQLRYVDYLERIEGLARYRTLHAPALSHVEAFELRAGSRRPPSKL